MPTWDQVPDALRDRLLTLYDQDCQEKTQHIARLAGAITMHPETLKRRLREWRVNKPILQDLAAVFPASPSHLHTDFLTISTDHCIIISDIEMPDQNTDMLRRALLLGMAHGITDLVIAGDMIASDQAALATHPITLVTGNEVSYRGTVKLARQMLQGFQRHFERVFIFDGNHDERLAKTTGGEVTLDMLLAGLDVTYSNYRFMWLETSRGIAT